MNTFRFWKMHGAGNDFVLIDDRACTFPVHDHIRLAALAGDRTGIGCEGVILVQNSDEADFSMLFFNPDGTAADMCGNGARCVAAFARAIGIAKSNAMTFKTKAGLVDAEVLPDGLVKVWLPEPKDRRYDVEVKTSAGTVKGDLVTTGVPHFVVVDSDTAKTDVAKRGREIRLSETFAPEGTNVDFVRYTGTNAAFMRTYERGVEAESGACGTGAAAVAVVGVETKGMALPMRIRTSKGFTLVVDGDWRRKKATGITLTGPVKKVFEGTIDLDALDVADEME